MTRSSPRAAERQGQDWTPTCLLSSVPCLFPSDEFPSHSEPLTRTPQGRGGSTAQPRFLRWKNRARIC